MAPRSGFRRPARQASSVLLPAPFSPMSACTSPGPTSRLAPSRATVGPKRFAIPVRRRAGWVIHRPPASFEIPLEGRADQLLGLGVVEVRRGHQEDPGVDPLLDRLSEEVLHHRPHSQVAHAQRVLEDRALELLGLHRVHEDLARVEAQEHDLARLGDVLQGEEHARGGGFVDREDPLDVGAEAVEQVLRGALGGVAGGAGVLVGGDHLHPGPRLLRLLEESALAVLGARRALLVAQEQGLALASEEPAQLIARQLTPLVVVRGHEAHDLVGLEAGVDHDRGDPEALRLLHWPHQGLRVEGGEDDPVHALAGEPLHDLDLLLAVVLAEGALPDDLDRDPIHRQVLAGLHRPRVDALPELVGEALGDDRDLEGLLRAGRGAGLLATGSKEEGQPEKGDEQAFGHDRPRESFPVFSSKRTRPPAAIAALAMWAARTASWPTRMLAFGVLRLRMQSSQLRRWATLPSPCERIAISGSGVLRQPDRRLSSLKTSRRSRSTLRVAWSPRNSRPPSSMLLP